MQNFGDKVFELVTHKLEFNINDTMSALQPANGDLHKAVDLFLETQAENALCFNILWTFDEAPETTSKANAACRVEMRCCGIAVECVFELLPFPV